MTDNGFAVISQRLQSLLTTGDPVISLRESAALKHEVTRE